MSITDRPPTAAALDTTASPGEREASPYGKCGPEYLPLLKSLLLAHNENRKNLKETRHKTIMKQIYSLMQGFDGTKAPCYCGCGQIMSIDQMEVHHINGDKHDNRIINTAAATPLCNKRLNGIKGGEINKQRAAAHKALFSVVAPAYVRESSAPTLTQTSDYEGAKWQSKEGKKHDIMRPKWDLLLWTLFNPEDEDLNWIGKGKLANFARSPDFVGTGTSTTFYKMIGEDTACGILKDDIHPDDMSDIVRMSWPSDPDKERLRELATAYSQGKISLNDLDDSIKAIAAPRKETRRHWNFLRWYTVKKLGKATP